MEVIGKAHGKAILLGEHFVVPNDGPGSPALAIPLPDLETQVRISDEGVKALACLPKLYQAPMLEAARLTARELGWDLESRPLRITSESNFPISRGFGSSAAFSVALIRAFQRLPGFDRLKLPAEVDLLGLAQRVENIFHGKSSGLDTAVIFEEKPIRYQTGPGYTHLRPFVNRAVDWVIVDSGPREQCAALVSRILSFRREKSAEWEAMAFRIGELVEAMLQALEKSEGAPAVTSAIEEAQGILAELGLASPMIESLLELGRKSGALAGKVSGAGGGGAVVFAARPGEGSSLGKLLRAGGATILSVVSSTEGSAP